MAAGVTAIINLRTKSEKSAAFDYEPECRRTNPATSFRHFPILDQNVADDAKVELLLAELLARLEGGAVLFVHCKGGHGRTGTICALLLGRLYGLRGAAALVRMQACHDCRNTPVYRAGGPDLPAAASALFPPQQAQVARLLAANERASPTERRLAALVAVGERDQAPPTLRYIW